MNKLFVIVMFVQLHLASIFSIFTEKMIQTTLKGHWEAIAAGWILETALLWLYLRALSAFPGKNIIDIVSEAAGKWLTRLILLPFIAFLLFHAALLLRYQVMEINVVILPNSPIAATAFLFLIIPLYAVWKGIHAIMRTSVALFIIFTPFIFFSLFISYKNFSIHNIFPLWDPTLSFFKARSFYTSLISYSGFLFLGMFALDKPLRMKSMLPAMLLLAFLYMAVVYVPLLIFGQESAVLMKYPAILASDTIDLEWVVFDWLPTFFIVMTSAYNILYTSVTMWIITVLLRRLFVPLSEKWIALALFAIVYVFDMRTMEMSTFNKLYSWNSLPCLYSAVMIPLVAALSSLWKRRAAS